TQPLNALGLSLALPLLLCVGPSVRAEQVQPNAPFVLGYADRLSCVAGEEIAFHLSSSGTTAGIVIQRVGGNTETVFEKSGIAVQTHPIPDRASSDGCDWPAAFSMTVPAEWTSGCYMATLTLEDEGQEAKTSVLFVVRAAEPGRNSKILLQLSTNTYNAYTNWGGHSLYSY